MRKLVLGTLGTAALVLVVGSTPAAQATVAAPARSGVAAVAPTTDLAHLNDWFAGVRAGSTKFTSGTNATCQPKVAKTVADTRCKVTLSGRFKATDQPYHGTYSGVAYVRYLDPKNSSYAAWDAGGVTYTVYDAQGTLLAKGDIRIDLGTGGVFGYPFDLSLSYAIEERTEAEGPGLVLRMTGVGINQLDGNLNPVRVFTDRLQYQSGI
jgi:hypothetical protein